MLLLEMQIAELDMQNIAVFLLNTTRFAYRRCSTTLRHCKVISLGVECNIILLFGIEICECHTWNSVFSYELRYKCIFKRHISRHSRAIWVGIDVRLWVIYFELRWEVDYRRLNVLNISATGDIKLICSSLVGL